MSIAQNLANIHARIQSACQRCGRDPREVTCLAVSKTHEPSAITQAYDAGQRQFAENYVQEYSDKRPLCPQDIEWHFIGKLQRNKVNKLLAMGSCVVHSVDTPALLDRLNRAMAGIVQRDEAAQPLPVLIEVRLGDENTAKSGVLPKDLAQIIDLGLRCEHLQLRGLMLIPPYEEDVELVRPYYQECFALWQRERERTGAPFSYLSMGMSHDFEVAIEEGATHIRVGTAIFGSRA